MARHQFLCRVSRPLSPLERELVGWMIEHGTPEARAYAEQVNRLGVVSECTCGCPTIDFGLDGRLAAPLGGSLVISDALGKSPEGIELNAILHVREDAIATLELYSVDGSGPFSLPRPESLTVI